MPAPRPRAYRVVAAILRPLLRLVTRRSWSGVEHLPRDGGFIVAANHVTEIDPVTLLHYLYDQGYSPRVLAKDSLFRIPVVGAVMRGTRQIPVARGTADAGASLQHAVRALREEQACVVVFPEGTLTRDPDLWPMRGRTGVARLALTTGVPVVPVAQWGAQDLLGWYARTPRPFPPKRITIVAGAPVPLDDLYDRPLDAATLREATERVLDAITALLEQVRGESAPAERFDMRRASGEGGTAAPGAGDAA